VANERWRIDRLILIAVAVCLLLATAIYFVIQRGKLGDLRLATDKTLLMSFAAMLLVLTFALVFVLVRSLARLVIERRRGVIGSRLRSRVTFSFLFLVMIPSLLLFGAAVEIVSRTLKDVAPPDLEDTLRSGSELAQAIYQIKQEQVAHFAAVLASEVRVREGESRARLARRLDAARQRFSLAAVGMIPRVGTPVSVTAAPSGEPRAVLPSELSRIPPGAAERVLATGRTLIEQGPMTYGWRVLVLHPVGDPEDPVAVAWACDYLQDPLARRLERVTDTKQQVTAFRSARPAAQRLYIVMFALLTGLIVFAAVWTGLYLARQITGPILELAKGTEALARGDLTYRVSAQGDDEVAQLGGSFNHMAEEIQKHRRSLVGRQRYIEALLESVPVGVVSLDPEGRVTTVNQAALEVLGLERLPRRVPLSGALGEDRAALVRTVEPVLSNRVGRVSTEVLIHVADRPVSVAVLAVRLLISDHEEGVLIVLEDLTRLRRAERVAAWGEVARRVAHEIKNPLTPIRLSAERMKRRYDKSPGEAGEVIQEGAATIVREVESLKTLIDEFSRFARLPEITLQSGDMRIVAEEAIGLYRQPHRGITFRLEAEPRLPAHDVDHGAMRRCLINVLDNAVAAVGERGRVDVRVRADEARGRIVTEVEDDGPGLDEEDLERLFSPTFSRKPGGTGLGLAIVYRIVTEHGGQVWAERSGEGGTRIVIELPTRESHRPRSEDAVAEESG
jgi:two-component system nitrogen regulation sensor histidine kinase NtrY